MMRTPTLRVGMRMGGGLSLLVRLSEALSAVIIYYD